LSKTDPFDCTWRERLIVLGSLYSSIAIFLGLGFIYDSAKTAELVGLAGVSFLAAGKFLPLWATTGQSQFGPYELGLVVWVLDTITVLTIVYALELFYKVRVLKSALERAHAKARLVLRAYPKVRRAALFGIFLFVLFPLAGTGAIGATFMGILLGLRRQVLFATVSAGGLAGGLIMAFAAVHFERAVLELRNVQGSWMSYAVVAAIALLLLGLLVWVSRAYHRALEQAAQSPDLD